MQAESEMLMLQPESSILPLEPTLLADESLPMEDVKSSAESEKTSNLTKFTLSQDLSLVIKSSSDIYLSNPNFQLETCKESM